MGRCNNSNGRITEGSLSRGDGITHLVKTSDTSRCYDHKNPLPTQRLTHFNEYLRKKYEIKKCNLTILWKFSRLPSSVSTNVCWLFSFKMYGWNLTCMQTEGWEIWPRELRNFLSDYWCRERAACAFPEASPLCFLRSNRKEFENRSETHYYHLKQDRPQPLLLKYSRSKMQILVNTK